MGALTRYLTSPSIPMARSLGGYSDPLLNKPFYPNGLVVGILTWFQIEGLGFKSQCVHFGHPSAGGCERSTGDPRLILGKGYPLVVLGGYGRTDPLLNKPFYPMESEQVDPPGSILCMGPPLSSAAILPIARLGRALYSCLPRNRGARHF
ncbi:unnamed protein product [Closterium sp. NIES-54]